MAFDGICIAAITKECNDKLINSRIYKIAQPEKDELILTLKAQSGTYRLFLSADASLPLLYFCEENKQRTEVIITLGDQRPVFLN